MDELTFDGLMERLTESFPAQRYAEGYALATDALPRFPQQRYWLHYMRACLAARLEQPDLAVGVLQEAGAEGIWFSRQLMRESPSFAPLQGQLPFEALVERFGALEASAVREPLLERVEPSGAPPPQGWPTVLALHGNGENGAATVQGWQPLAEQGWLLAAAQSSQLITSHAYVWDDRALAVAEVTAHAESLRAAGLLDEGRFVVAGFSLGGDVAARVALSGAVAARGFLLIGPAIPPLEEQAAWDPWLAGAAARGLRGWIVLGEADSTIEHAALDALAARLNGAGIPCRLERHAGLGHHYPDNFGALLARALPWLVGDA